jgi:uncharacterized protein YkwD
MLNTVSLRSTLRWLCLGVAVLLASCGGGSDPASNSIVSQANETQSSTQTSTAVNTQTTVPANTLDAAFTCGIPNFQDEILKRVNQARASGRMCGNTLYDAVAPLKWNTSLFNAAAGHSYDMATTDFFSHTSLDGRSFAQRIATAGYAWRTIGENIAAGQSSIDEVFNVWMDSPGHCANIMSGNYSEIGMACAGSTSATYSNYWTMDLGHPG